MEQLKVFHLLFKKLNHDHMQDLPQLNNRFFIIFRDSARFWYELRIFSKCLRYLLKSSQYIDLFVKKLYNTAKAKTFLNFFSAFASFP